MVGIRFNWLLVPVVALVTALATPSFAQTTASTDGRAARSQQSSKRIQTNGHVYLLRGLMNIFSLGMDDLAAKIQARGISASVHNHSEWQALADDIAVKYKARQHGPVVLVGHSLGADAVMFMAEYLGKKGVPVALVVPFDGTGSFAASSNVSQVYNLTQRDYAHMRRGAGFRGTLSNVDLSGQGYGHIDIDKSPKLHALVLQRIQSVIRRGSPRPAAPVTQQAQPAAKPADAAPPTTGSTPAASPAAPATVKPAADDSRADAPRHVPAVHSASVPAAGANASRAAASTASGQKHSSAHSSAASKPAVPF